MKKVSWTIGRKLMVACAGSLLVTLALAYTCWFTVRSVGSSLQSVTQRTSRQMDMAADIRTAASEMRGAVRQTVVSVVLKDSGDYEKAKTSFAAGAAQTSRLLEDIGPFLPDEQSRAQRDVMVRELANWRTSYGEMIQLCEQSRVEEANEVRKTRQRPIADGIVRAATALVDSAKARMKEAAAEGERSVSTSAWIAGFLIALATLVGIAVLVVVRRNMGALQLLTSEVMQAADQVSGASAQVSSASQAIAQGVTQQAASLEENSAASEEVDSVCAQGASRSETAVSLMADAAAMVAEANTKLSRMTDSMNRIGASSGQISKIIKVIDEIAFQTNILALNAAVEAARAGEAGAGFAVVADEVRNLAQRCAQAANDTGGLVQDSIATSGEACRNAEEVSQAINGLCDAATRAKTIIDEVHLGAKEQARGIGQIASGIVQIQQATQSSAAAAEQCAAAGQELSAQSESMRGIAWRLSAVVGAAGSW